MRSHTNRFARAFSLIELVIVVVIIGIIAAIAIPRMSRGAAGASDSALAANLALLRNAIDLFSAEHNSTYPTLANLPNALTQYSDIAGTDFAPGTDAAHPYGPYLRAIPPIPVGARKGSTGFGVADGVGIGWIYTVGTGSVTANAAGNDGTGKPYSSY